MGQRRHEAENARLLLDGFLDHDGDSQGHEGLGEVNDTFPGGCDGEGRDNDVSFLYVREKKERVSEW